MTAENQAPEGDERALFEHAERASDLARDEDCPEDYRNTHVQSAWDGWQKRAALAAQPQQAPQPRPADSPMDEDEQWTLDRAADLLDGYAEHIRSVGADNLQYWPYLPEVEMVAKGLRTIAAPAQCAAEGDDEQREPAPPHSLPMWIECARIVENHEFRQRAAAGLEGAVLDLPEVTPAPTALHRFIHEYDDSDPYRSDWFIHRLELVVKEAQANVQPKGTPAGYKLLEDGKTMIPDGWTPLRLEWEPGYPEDVAFGPQRMMDRLKKWLDRYFAARVAEAASPAPAPAPEFANRPESMRCAGCDLINGCPEFCRCRPPAAQAQQSFSQGPFYHPSQEIGDEGREATLKELGEDLHAAGHDFFYALRREGAGGGAVRWVNYEDGTVIIFTRGEYRDRIMAVVDDIGQPVWHWTEEGEFKAGERESSSPAVAHSNDRWTVISPAGEVFTGESPFRAASVANKHWVKTDPEAAKRFAAALESIRAETEAENARLTAEHGTLDCPACGGSGHVGDIRTAASDVLAERHRQISVEGWTADHDDEHDTEEMAFAAACYATADEGDAPPAVWPWDWQWWKPKDRRRNLVKAGALILAELERLDRAASKPPVQGSQP